MPRSKTMAISLLLLLLSFTSWAQQTNSTAIPNLIRYSGTVRDSQGVALSSSAVGITFAIYKRQEEGAPIWLETQTVTTDVNGQYNVLLGSTGSTGLPSDLFSAEEQRWLGVQVQGQAEQPRVLLVSVPYALRAHDAETLAGKSISDFVLAKDLNSTTTAMSASTSGQSTSQSSDSPPADKAGVRTGATNQGPTNFSGSTTNEIVSIAQSGTGFALLTTVPNGTSIDAQVTASTSANSTGVFGTVTGLGTGVFGNATSASGFAQGVQGNSGSTSGSGVVGLASASTGSTYGVKGYASSTGGTGMRGLASASSGYTYGVSGAVASATGTGVWGQAQAGNGGTGVWGQSLATTGAGIGVLASAASSAGTGVMASESSASGLTFGLNALVQSPSGIAGWFQNTAGGALIVGASGGGSNQTTEFSVDGLGDVTAMGFVNAGTTYQVGGVPVLSTGAASSQNLFLGRYTGSSNTGDLNLFAGELAGHYNIIGSSNAFLGIEAGYSNENGNNNSYVGFQSGFVSLGSNNTYVGASVAFNGYPGDLGSNNTYVGYESGYNNTSGSNNISVGYQSGLANGTGNSNIYLGSQGVSSENNVIRIGMQGSGTGQQNAAYMAGVYTSTVSGVAVYVNANGQLGTLSSSRRFKENIQDIADRSDKLMLLRPVSFFYKPEYTDGPQSLQYGLIAEEVAGIYPELVEFSESGEPYTVRYNLLISMMLNELQKQYRREARQQGTINQQDEQIQHQQLQIEELQKENGEIQERLSRLENLLVRQRAAVEEGPGQQMIRGDEVRHPPCDPRGLAPM